MTATSPDQYALIIREVEDYAKWKVIFDITAIMCRGGAEKSNALTNRMAPIMERPGIYRFSDLL